MEVSLTIDDIRKGRLCRLEKSSTTRESCIERLRDKVQLPK